MKKMRIVLAFCLTLTLTLGLAVVAGAVDERITFPSYEEALKLTNRNHGGWQIIQNDNGTVTAVRVIANSAQPTQQEPVQSGFPADYFEEYAEEIIRLVNIERENAGLSPLTVNPLLMDAAMIRAEELSQRYSHTRPDDRRWSTVFSEVGYRHNGAAENIAGRARGAQQQVDSWMNSEGHHRNIMNPNFSEIGVAVTPHGAVQLFARPR